MSVWRETEIKSGLKEIIDYRGKTPPKSESGILLISAANIKDGKFDFSKQSFISLEDYEEWTVRGFTQPGDILITTEAPVGEVALLPADQTYQISRRVMALRTNEKVLHNKFLCYALQNPMTKAELLSASRGSTVPRVLKTDITEFEILAPDYSEQKAIAQVLSSLDDKIDLLHRQNKTLEAIAETLFRQWFIEEAQDDWEEKPLGALVTITSSKRIFYSEYVDSGVPFYRSKEIIEFSSSGSSNSELYITEARFKDIKEKFGAPEKGDILLTSVGTLGIPYRVKGNNKFYFKDGNLTWFKDFDIVPSIIIFCWLKSNIGQEQLDSITIGSTQAALTISGLKEIPLLVPPLSVIANLELELTRLYRKVDFNQTQIRTLEKLRDTLLPKLMSGEVRVAVEPDLKAA